MGGAHSKGAQRCRTGVFMMRTEHNPVCYEESLSGPLLTALRHKYIFPK